MPIRTRSLNLNDPALARPSRGAQVLRRVQRLQGMPQAQRVLGVDPGLHRTGYGVIELGKRAEAIMVEAGVLRAKATDPLPKRLQELHAGLAEVLRDTSPDVVVVEDLFSTYAHPRSALLMAHARGVLMLAAEQAGVPVHSFTPNEVKQVVTGHGHATKSEIQAAVRARLRLAVAPNPPDVADALAIALCFAARQTVS